MRRPYHELRKEELAHLVKHVLVGGNWPILEQILVDYDYIVAKCTNGLVESLRDDFRRVLAAHPSRVARTAEEEDKHSAIAVYVQRLIGEIASQRKCAARSNRTAFDLSSPDPPASIAPLTDEEIDRGVALADTARTSEGDLEAIAEWLAEQSHVLDRLGANPDFVRQQVLNSPVARILRPQPICDRRPGSAVAALTTAASTAQPTQRRSALLRTIEMNGAYLRRVALSADGATAVTGADDGVLRVWNVVTGECNKMIAGQPDRILSLNLTPDGRYCVTGGSDGYVGVVDLETRQHLRLARDHQGWVRGAAISADGRLIITASVAGRLLCWDVHRDVCIQSIPLEDLGDIQCLASTADGLLAVSGHALPKKHRKGPPLMINVWDMRLGKRIGDMYDMFGAQCLALTPDGRHLLTNTVRGELQFWAIGTPTPLRRWSAHKEIVADVAVTADGRHAVSVGHEGTLKVWSTKDGTCHRVLDAHTTPSAVAVSADGRVVLSLGGGRNDQLRIWDVLRGGASQPPNAESDPPNRLRIQPQHHAVIAIGNTTVTVRELDSLRLLCAHSCSAVRGFSVQGASSGIATWVDDRHRVIFWRIRDESPPSAAGIPYSATSALMSHDGRFVIVPRFDRWIELWSCSPPQLIRTIFRDRGEVPRLHVLRDGRFVFARNWRNAWRIWDMKTGVARLGRPGPRSEELPVFSADERVAMVPTKDNVLKGHSLVTGQAEWFLHSDRGSFRWLNVAPDGRMLLCQNDDYTVSVWDLQGCSEIASFKTSAAVNRAFTPDCQYYVTTGRDDVVSAWGLRTGELVAARYDPRGIRASSNILPDGRFAVHFKNGDEEIWKLDNVDLDFPVVTSVNRWIIDHDKSARGKWSDTASFVCPWCGCESNVPSEAERAIVATQATLEELCQPIGCLGLPDSLWGDDRLLQQCPSCGNSLRFTPFAIDNRQWTEPGREVLLDKARFRSLGDTEALATRCMLCGNSSVGRSTFLADERVLCSLCLESLVNRPETDWQTLKLANTPCCACGHTSGDEATLIANTGVCASCIAVFWENYCVAAGRGTLLRFARKEEDDLWAKVSDQLRVLYCCHDGFEALEAAPQAAKDEYLRNVVAMLGWSGGSPFTELMRDLAEDSCIGLGTVVITHLCTAWSRSEAQERCSIVYVAGRISSADSVVRTLLDQAVRDPAPTVRARVGWAVAHDDSEWTRCLLEPLLWDEDAFVCKETLRVFNVWDDERGELDRGADDDYRMAESAFAGKLPLEWIEVKLPELRRKKATRARVLATRMEEFLAQTD
jgi:WD40 repeat protein